MIVVSSRNDHRVHNGLHATAAIGVQVNRMTFHGYCDGLSMVLQVGWIPPAVGIRSGRIRSSGSIRWVRGECHGGCQVSLRGVGSQGMAVDVSCRGSRRIVGRGRAHALCLQAKSAKEGKACRRCGCEQKSANRKLGIIDWLLSV